MTSNLSRLMAVVFVGALTGCPAPADDTDDTDTDGETDDTDITACNPGVKTPTLPENGADDVYFRTPFAISFQQDADEIATFALTKDSDSSAVTLGSVTWSTDGKNAAFAPAASLEPSTAYTLTITYSCNAELAPKIQFTTDATGSAVDDSEAFIGFPYALDLSTATIIKPAGVQALLGQLLGQLEDAIIVVPKSYDSEANTLEFFGGLATVTGGSVSQDVCTETIVFPELADFSENPYWEIVAPDGIELTVSDVTIELLSLELSGAFNPDASAVVGVQLAGLIDTRAIAGLLGDELGGGDGDDAVCTLVGQLTGGLVACQECPGGAGPYCLELQAANIRADQVDGSFEEIDATDVAENESCAEVVAAQ